MEATNRSAFVKCRQDDFKLQSWALTDRFSTISSGLLKNKNDFKTLPSEPECYIHLFVKTSVICWLVFCCPPHPPASHSFVSELMFPASTLHRPWLFVRQSELMQICKLFPFVKCQKNTCKSLALALSCQLALLEAGDKWQSITQHAFKGRGDLFQNHSIGAAFNNISKIRSQHQFFLPLFLPLLLNEWQHIWELFKALGISIPLPTIWESDGIMGACQKCCTLSGDWRWGRGCAPPHPCPSDGYSSPHCHSAAVRLKLNFCLPLPIRIMLKSLDPKCGPSTPLPHPPHSTPLRR